MFRLRLRDERSARDAAALIRAAAPLLLLLTASAGAARAEDAPRRAEPAPVAEALDESTEELFNDAVAELDAGRTGRAQRLFEEMIARAPASALASEARRYLADLYRASVGAGPGVVSPAPVRETAARRTETADNGGTRTIAGGPDAGLRVPAALEERFISEAGDRVFFSLGSAELGSRARGVLAAQARFILRRDDLSATIEGHADDGTLSADELVRLSEARAEAVRQRLVAEGIEPDRLMVVAYGRDRRVSACPEPECAAQNRRAVTVLVRNTRRMGLAPLDRPRPEAPAAARGASPLTH